MLHDLLVFAAALVAVALGSAQAVAQAVRLAEGFRLSRYVVGFLVVAVISILPETFIALQAAADGVPAMGLGMLFGSNVADLTLVFAACVFLAGRELKVEAKILKLHAAYPFLLLLPIVLGVDGYLSRVEGGLLVGVGALFYVLAFRGGHSSRRTEMSSRQRWASVLWLVGSMAVLLVGSRAVVDSAVALAGRVGVSPILVGMLVVGLGTTVPELFFSVRAARRKDDALAVGDLLGTVLADATVVVGLLALVQPFAFPARIVLVTGACMAAAAFLLFRFLASGRVLTRREAWILLAFWVGFVAVETAFGAAS